MSAEQYYAQAPSIITISEADHFAFGSLGRAELIASLLPVIRNHARNGFRKPREVARLLNKAGVRTAIGTQ
jgi:hypothetical protein